VDSLSDVQDHLGRKDGQRPASLLENLKSAAVVADQWHDGAHLRVVSHTDCRFPEDAVEPVDRPLFVDGPQWPTRASAAYSSSSLTRCICIHGLHWRVVRSRHWYIFAGFALRYVFELTVSYPYRPTTTAMSLRQAAAELNWQHVWQWAAEAADEAACTPCSATSASFYLYSYSSVDNTVRCTMPSFNQSLNRYNIYRTLKS